MTTETIDRNSAITEIKNALKRRSGKSWSATGGRGTAWGWITVDAPPVRRTAYHQPKEGTTGARPEDYELVNTGIPGGNMTIEDQKELAALLGFEDAQCWQGISIPASSKHYIEYVDRANGRTPSAIGEQYWD